MECPVCYDTMREKENAIKHLCQHMFCDICEKELKKRSMKCPMCRTNRYNLSINNLSSISIVILTEYLTGESERSEPEGDFAVRIHTWPDST